MLLLLLVACADPGPGDPPVDLMSLAPVIADLQVGESIVGEVPVLLRDSMRTVYYESILAEHGHTREEFDSLLWIVRREPAWVDSLYSAAGNIIATRIAEDEADVDD